MGRMCYMKALMSRIWANCFPLCLHKGDIMSSKGHALSIKVTLFCQVVTLCSNAWARLLQLLASS